MSTNNSVVLVGHISEPKMAVTPNGVKVINRVGLCVHDVDFNSKETQEWFDLKAWRGVAEVLCEAGKGAKVRVTGRLEVRRWEKDGVKHMRTYVLVQKVEVLARPKAKPTIDISDCPQ
jgi:single-stranded DNA-binding protein